MSQLDDMYNTPVGWIIARRDRFAPVAINGAEVSHLLNSHDQRPTTASAVHVEKVIRNLTERATTLPLSVALVKKLVKARVAEKETKKPR